MSPGVDFGQNRSKMGPDSRFLAKIDPVDPSSSKLGDLSGMESRGEVGERMCSSGGRLGDQLQRLRTRFRPKKDQKRPFLAKIDYSHPPIHTNGILAKINILLFKFYNHRRRPFGLRTQSRLLRTKSKSHTRRRVVFSLVKMVDVMRWSA